MMPPAGTNDNGHHTASPARSSAAPAFTLVEMIVVVAVIVVVLGFILPAASTLWNERKNSQAINAVQGLLMTTRARAMAADGVQSGLLAFVDKDGTQRMVSIAKLDPVNSTTRREQYKTVRIYGENVGIFEITDDREVALPQPMRVVPGEVADINEFSAAELTNNDFANPIEDVDEAQRHRNFFTVIFSTDGNLLVKRDVLIRDEDNDDPPDGLGDRTGLRVGPGPPQDEPKTTQYYCVNSCPEGTEPGDAIDIDPDGDPEEIPFLVIDEDDEVAINFAPVDVLLVYDDSSFNEVTTSQKREVLTLQGQPLYVNRWTGAVIKGPVGETETP
jgi:type II secretory pathway pseudopilin PulG